MPEIDWERLQQAVGQAFELPAEDRQSFLRDLLENEPELLREALSLVTAGSAASGFLERPLLSGLEAPEADLTGTRIDRYRLLSKIASGGMGDVYEAERDDGEYQRRVAIKLLHRSAGTAWAVERFRTERQILAGLDHPHIATILDGGTGDDGQPYFVMRRVEGVPLDRYCDSEGLAFAQRLDLVVKVCDAVAHAHRRLVIHCDIKPSNIVVDARGEPQLLDFGIAHLLDGASLEVDEPETREPRALTPGYASPEQLAGEPLGTATDVYSLGALLHKVLLGRAPRAAGSPETTALPRPVQAILERAIAADPAQRYASAADLAADIRRYRAAEPVTAMPPSATYRFRCFLRRHWAAAAIVGVLAAATVTLILYQQRQSRALERERDEARRERATTDEVASFLVDLFEVAEPDNLQGRQLTVEEILDRGGQQAASRFVARPEIRAQLLTTVGRVNRKVGRYDEAIEQQRQALDLRLQTLPEGDPTIVESLIEMGDTHLAREEFTAAEAFFRNALRRAPASGPAATDLERSGSLGLARVLTTLAEHEEAERILRDLIAQGEAESAAEPDWLAEAWSQLGRLLQVSGDLEGAEDAVRQALAMQVSAGRQEHPAYSQTLMVLSQILRYSGDFDQATEVCQQATDLKRELYGERHPTVAVAFEHLAELASLRGDLDESERLHHRAIRLYGETVGTDTPFYGSMLNNLAVVLRKRGDLDGALRETRRALAIYREVWGEEHPHTHAAIYNLGFLEERSGRLGEAEAFLRQAVELGPRALGPEHPDRAYALVRLGDLLRRRGRCDEAEATLREGLALRRAALPRDHRLVADAAGSLGVCLAALGHRDEAAELLRESRPRLHELRGPDHERTRDVTAALASLER